jgi:hypothetical protein
MLKISRIDIVGQNGPTGDHYDHERPPEASERDPAGIDPHHPGAKLDEGKPLAGTVLGGFAQALREVVDVGTFGANKYTTDGWKSVNGGFQRYTDAMLRHYLYETSGEEWDKDSGLRHAAHLAWNALARLEFLLEEERRRREFIQDGKPF